MTQLQKPYDTYKGYIKMVNNQVALQFPSKQLFKWAVSLEENVKRTGHRFLKKLAIANGNLAAGGFPLLNLSECTLSKSTPGYQNSLCNFRV